MSKDIKNLYIQNVDTPADTCYTKGEKWFKKKKSAVGNLSVHTSSQAPSHIFVY